MRSNMNKLRKWLGMKILPNSIVAVFPHELDIEENKWYQLNCKFMKNGKTKVEVTKLNKQ